MKLEVTRGIECGERGDGNESGHCRVCGEWHGGVECDKITDDNTINKINDDLLL